MCKAGNQPVSEYYGLFLSIMVIEQVPIEKLAMYLTITLHYVVNLVVNCVLIFGLRWELN